MVNYCAVEGCRRNCKKSKNLTYYSLPKDKTRLEKWLRAIGREDILKSGKSLNYRVCSRHFARTSIKNKHLCADAVPTLNLPGSYTGASDSSDEGDNAHTDVICNSCNEPILGFRYKCITCDDYDLCNKCEFNEEHSEHYMVRIPKPAKSKIADDLAQKWKQFLAMEGSRNLKRCHESSDDDVPITKYVRNYDSGIDVSEDMKDKIRQEVTRVLDLMEESQSTPSKRKSISKKRKESKRGTGSDDGEHPALPPQPTEVVFADVDNLTSVQLLEVKEELQCSYIPNEGSQEPEQAKTETENSNTFCEFMIDCFGEIRQRD